MLFFVAIMLHHFYHIFILEIIGKPLLLANSLFLNHRKSNCIFSKRNRIMTTNFTCLFNYDISSTISVHNKTDDKQAAHSRTLNDKTNMAE